MGRVNLDCRSVPELDFMLLDTCTYVCICVRSLCHDVTHYVLHFPVTTSLTFVYEWQVGSTAIIEIRAAWNLYF